jgi:hypothetical protein
MVNLAFSSMALIEKKKKKFISAGTSNELVNMTNELSNFSPILTAGRHPPPRSIDRYKQPKGSDVTNPKE